MPKTVLSDSFENARNGNLAKLSAAYDSGAKRLLQAGEVEEAKRLGQKKAAYERQFTQTILDKYAGSQLLLNAGFEEQLDGGRIPSWTSIAGKWTQSSQFPAPGNGKYCSISSGARDCELMQMVEIRNGKIQRLVDSSRVQYQYTIRVKSLSAADQAALSVKFYKTPKGPAISEFQSEYSAPTTWKEISATGKIPIGTRYIRVSLRCVATVGGSADVNFDDASFTVLTRD